MPRWAESLQTTHRAALLDFAEDENLLTTTPAEHEGSRGLRTIDPSLGVWVNTSTTAKTALLRRIFAALNLDTEDLIFTLRPRTNDTTKTPDTDVAPEHNGTYAELTKFLDAVTEANALSSSMDTTADLRDEMAREFDPWRRESWMQDLGGQPLGVFTAATPVAEMTADQILAVITGLFASEAMLGPGAVHQSIIDGSMVDYLTRLDALG